MNYNHLFKLCFLIFLFPLFSFGINLNDSIRVVINPHFNHQEIRKTSWYFSSNKDSIQLKSLKFYITSFQINEENISENNFLVDVFDEKTTEITFPKNNKEKLKILSFNIGVEDKMNTSGALSGDLDVSKGMYWSWQSGYINFKIEGISPSCNTRKNKFQFHIGGYKKPYKTKRNIVYKIKKIKDEIIIDLDVALFFNTVNLKKQNQIMIPGKEANIIADILPKLFSIKSE